MKRKKDEEESGAAGEDATTATTVPSSSPAAEAPSSATVTPPPVVTPTASLAPVTPPVTPAGTLAAEVAAKPDTPAPAVAPVIAVTAPPNPLSPVVHWKECDGTPYNMIPEISIFAMNGAETHSPEKFTWTKKQLQCAMVKGDCEQGYAANLTVGALHYDKKALVWHVPGWNDGKVHVVIPVTLKEPIKEWKRYVIDFNAIKCIDDARKYLEYLKKEGKISSFEISPEMTTTAGVVKAKFCYAFVTNAKTAIKDDPLKCYIFKTSATRVTR
eukprot:jgi/Mesvir1/19814/Mv13104-RA.1